MRRGRPIVEGSGVQLSGLATMLNTKPMTMAIVYERWPTTALERELL
jgi:hypothetical protein